VLGLASIDERFELTSIGETRGMRDLWRIFLVKRGVVVAPEWQLGLLFDARKSHPLLMPVCDIRDQWFIREISGGSTINYQQTKSCRKVWTGMEGRISAVMVKAEGVE
jgi:hypothetical protein